MPDRWRILETLGVIEQRFKDPYRQNVFKGDKPYKPFAWGDDVFLSLSAVSASLVEARRLPISTGIRSSNQARDPSGPSDQRRLGQSFLVGASLVKGNTTFRPPDYEYRLVLAASLDRTRLAPLNALPVDPGRGRVLHDGQLAVLEAFYGKHRRNVSERYDFDSYRAGVQPLTSDFRGFVFQENALGLRFFGNRGNNRTQYNLAALARLEKDATTGLVDLWEGPRADLVLLANLYRQDFPRPGHTTQVTVINDWNGEDGPADYDESGFQARPAVLGEARPHRYSNVTYLGANGDGHFGKWNLTTSLYGVVGHDSHHPLARRPQTVLAGFGAMELSRDFDWVRGRLTLIGATADRDPFDGMATGFDAISENPVVAGADTGFWIRNAVPLGRGSLVLSGRNGVLPSLRSSTDQGRSNFVNPGLLFIGLGADLDVTPQVRVVTNASGIAFANTSVLSVLRELDRLDRFVGVDASMAFQVRPLMTQNIVLNVSGAVLLPGAAFKQLHARSGPQYSFLLNLLLSY